MNRRKYSLRGVLLMFLTLLPAVARSSPLPLTILNKSLDHEDRVLSFELWNTGDKVINAWRLSLAHDDGSGRSRRSALDQDFAFAAESPGGSTTKSPADHLEGPIRPGAVLEAEWTVDLPEASPESAVLSLRVTAVVFEDGTFAGDGEASKTILAGRRARLEEMQRTAEFLRAAQANSRLKGRLREDLKARASALRSEVQEESPVEGLRREVAAQLSAVRLEMAEFLEGLAASLGKSEVIDGRAAVERAITDLDARVALGAGWAARRRGPGSSEDADRAVREVY